MQSKWTVKTSVLVALVLALILVQAAGAGNFHFKTYSLSLGSLVLNGDLAGVGNANVVVTLTGYGTVKAMCENNGGNQAPGRNPIFADVQQSETYETDENGRALVTVTTQDPTLDDIAPSPTPKQAGCPNGNWKVVGTVDGSTDWKAADIVVKDGSGQVQIYLSLTCKTTIQNGVSTNVKCWEK